jgi:hypothetical protein
MNNIKFRSNSIGPEVYNQIALFVKKNPNTTAKNISTKFKIAVSTVSKILKRLGLSLTRKNCFSSKYNIDESFFEEINTPEKAQILGLIFADGTMSKHNKNISIRLNEDDREYLENIKSIIKSNKPLGYIKPHDMISPLNGKTYSAKGTVILDMARKKIYEDLKLLGICCRKTYKDFEMPPIPHELIRYFLLGLYEGDGCITCSFAKTGKISSCCFSVVVSENMGNFLQKYLEQTLEINGVHLYKRNNIHILSIQRQSSLLKIGEFLYGGETSFYMSRKKKKWENIRTHLL